MNLIYTCIYICSVLHPETSGPECPIEMILIWSATEAVALPSPCQSSHAKSHIPYLFKHPAYWPLSPPPCHPGDNAPVHFPFSRLSCLQADTGSSSRDMQLQHSRPQYCPGTVPQGRGTLQVVSWVGGWDWAGKAVVITGIHPNRRRGDNCSVIPVFTDYTPCRFNVTQQKASGKKNDEGRHGKGNHRHSGEASGGQQLNEGASSYTKHPRGGRGHTEEHRRK